jgi:large subunit ribosomal protein L24
VVNMKLKKDDTVQVIAGKEKGKQGKLLKINRDSGRVIVAGLNMVKKAMKKRKQNDRGGIEEIEAAIDASNVMIVCKKCGPTRVGIKMAGDDKQRVCRKCGEVL